MLKNLVEQIRDLSKSQWHEGDQRERFEASCFAHYLQRHARGKTADRDAPPMTRDHLLWRDDAGKYGVGMFNAAWWGWKNALTA